MIETPKAIIKGNLRRLFLRSKERNEVLKRDKYTCQQCGVKQSKKKGFEQKVQVHHKEGVLNWADLIEMIRKYLLCSPDKMETLCPECHKSSQDNQNGNSPKQN